MIIEWLVPEAFVARCFWLLQISKISKVFQQRLTKTVKLRKFLKRFLHESKVVNSLMAQSSG